jgi:uncharacterized protein (DUF3820 family)
VYPIMPEPDPILQFGCHKGKHISDVPTSYLDWLLGEGWVYPELKDQIERHLRTRADWLSADLDGE